MATYSEILKRDNVIMDGVLVALYNSDGSIRIDVDTTDEFGRFSFTSLATGYYQLQFFGKNYDSDDIKYISIIEDLPTGENFDPKIRQERLVAMFNSISWTSRAIIEACVNENLAKSGNTMSLRDDIIQPPASPSPLTAYVYQTNSIDLELPDKSDKATLIADYTLQGSSNLKIETTLSGIVDAHWFTWLDTTNTTPIGSGEYWPAGFYDLRDVEVTTSGITTSGITISGITLGNSGAVKITLTTDSSSVGGYLTSLGFFTNSVTV